MSQTETAVVTPPTKRAADRKVYGKTRVTNGSELLPGVDNRNLWVRRCRDIITAHLSDLGGDDNTSAAERSIIRRAAVLTTELERLEAKFAAAGEASDSDLDLYQRGAGNLRRLLEAVGLQRRAKSIGPTLGDLIRQDQDKERARLAREREQTIEATS
jgi:hypothetical protein